MHKKLKRILAVMLSAVMTAGMMTGCGTTGGSAEGGALDTFTFVSTEPNTLNMLESNSNLDEYVFYLTSAMLYRSVDGEVAPELCDTVEVSSDGCTYTYKIKEAKYSDGSKIKAEDFVYYIIHKYITAENSSYFVGGEATLAGSLDTCEGIYAKDDLTFVVTLNHPIVTFDGKMEIYPLQKAFADAKGKALGGTPADFLYSGPYILDNWVVGSSMEFSKNKDYIAADSLFPTEKLKMVVSSDASTTYSMYANGEVDAIISASNDMVEMIGKDKCKTIPTGNLYGLEYNTTGFTYAEGSGFAPRNEKSAALMKNNNFRKALSYALDRNAMVTTLEPAGTATNHYVNKLVKGTSDKAYVDEYSLKDTAPLGGDANAAKKYLQQAMTELGYSDVSQLPEISFLTFENDSQKKLAESMVSTWKNVLGLNNVKINLQPIQSAISSMVYMNYDIYMMMSEVLDDDMLAQLSYWETTGGLSDIAGFQAQGAPAMMVSMHANSEYDSLVTEAYTDFDDTSRFKKICQAEQMLYSDFAYFPLFQGGNEYAVRDYVEGFTHAYVDNGYSFAHLVVKKH